LIEVCEIKKLKYTKEFTPVENLKEIPKHMEYRSNISKTNVLA
jgi:hypothetical protein|tara:strand:+ start:563 stop:691 length:129 start_codon:yes stop_codon:yes gene_type:complete